MIAPFPLKLQYIHGRGEWRRLTSKVLSLSKAEGHISGQEVCRHSAVGSRDADSAKTQETVLPGPLAELGLMEARFFFFGTRGENSHFAEPSGDSKDSN